MCRDLGQELPADTPAEPSHPARDMGKVLDSATCYWSNRVTSKRLFLSDATASLLRFSYILSSCKSSMEVSSLLAPIPFSKKVMQFFTDLFLQNT